MTYSRDCGVSLAACVADECVCSPSAAEDAPAREKPACDFELCSCAEPGASHCACVHANPAVPIYPPDSCLGGTP